MLCEDPQVFKDDEMVAAFEMAIEVGPPVDNSQIFEFDFAHLEDEIRAFGMILITEGLARKTNNFFNFLLDSWSVIVKMLVDEAIRVDVLTALLPFQPGDQTVELANDVKQGLLPKEYVLEHFFAVYAVVEVDVDKGLADEQVLRVVCVGVGLELLDFKVTKVVQGDGIFLEPGNSQRFVL